MGSHVSMSGMTAAEDRFENTGQSVNAAWRQIGTL